MKRFSQRVTNRRDEFLSGHAQEYPRLGISDSEGSFGGVYDKNEGTVQNAHPDLVDMTPKCETSSSISSEEAGGATSRLASLGKQCRDAIQSYWQSNLINAREQSQSWLAIFDACAAGIGLFEKGKGFTEMQPWQTQVVMDVLYDLLELLRFSVEPDPWELHLSPNATSSPAMSFTSWSTDDPGPGRESPDTDIHEGDKHYDSSQSEPTTAVVDPAPVSQERMSHHIHASIASRSIDELLDRLIDMSERLAHNASSFCLHARPMSEDVAQHAEFQSMMYDMLQTGAMEQDQDRLTPEQIVLVNANLVRRERFELPSLKIAASTDHVDRKDVLPYTCPMADCTGSIAMFARQTDWIAHLQRDHALPSHWECIACDHKKLFLGQVVFEEHVLKEHSATISKEHMADMLEMSQRHDLVHLPQSCPVCNVGRNGMEQFAFIDHLAGCIHDFSLLSHPGQADFDYGSDTSRSRGSSASVDASNSEERIDAKEGLLRLASRVARARAERQSLSSVLISSPHYSSGGFRAPQSSPFSPLSPNMIDRGADQSNRNTALIPYQQSHGTGQQRIEYPQWNRLSNEAYGGTGVMSLPHYSSGEYWAPRPNPFSPVSLHMNDPEENQRGADRSNRNTALIPYQQSHGAGQQRTEYPQWYRLSNRGMSHDMYQQIGSQFVTPQSDLDDFDAPIRGLFSDNELAIKPKRSARDKAKD